MKRPSPFTQLLRYVENELFDLSLDLQLPREERRWQNADFIHGYRAALNLILQEAYTIYNRRMHSEFISLHPAKEESTERLLELLEKRGC